MGEIDRDIHVYGRDKRIYGGTTLIDLDS